MPARPVSAWPCPVEEFLQLRFGARVDRRLRVDEALLQRQLAGAAGRGRRPARASGRARPPRNARRRASAARRTRRAPRAAGSCRRDAMVCTCQPLGATGALKSRGARGVCASSSFSWRAAVGSASRSTPAKPSSCMPKRPARPAIWCTSDSFSGRSSRPSNLVIVLNSTRRIGRFRPMPIASVATRMCDSPCAKRSASRRRTSGGSAP